jgi:hypothetical protein
MEFHEQITIGAVFFVFAFFVSLGFWQILAAYHGFRAFSVLRDGARVGWGYLLGAALILVAGVWFFGTRTEDIFSPGPASSEFLFFLSLALLCALVTSMVASSLVGRLFHTGSAQQRNPYVRKEVVATSLWEGALYLPALDGGPWRGVCIVPGPLEGAESVSGLASELARKGVACLIVPAADGRLWRYPDVLAMIPQAVGRLERREDVDARRVGLLGVGLGADLALRAAASDEQVGPVVALSPLLSASSVRRGVDLLREMSYLEAIRWYRAHQGGELVAELAALEYLPGLGSRPLLVVYGERDRLAEPAEKQALPAGAELMVLKGAGRKALARYADALGLSVSWFMKHL